MENNWFIRLTDENRDIVVKYFNKKCGSKLNGANNFYYGIFNNELNYWNSKPKDIQELTFEEFKTQILGQGYKSEILSTSTNNPSINNDFGVVFGSDNKFHKSDLDLNITPKQIQSDGGSTQYYQIEITNSKGEKFNCELNDILRDVFNNQWDLCNIVKASRRISEARKGQGKKDVSIKYDANKIIWFAEEIKKLNK